MVDRQVRNSKVWWAFGDYVEYGSPEHFYHFMWGYLLPSLRIIDQRKSLLETYLFRDFGPISNDLVTQVAALQGLELEISPEAPGEADIVPVPR